MSVTQLRKQQPEPERILRLPAVIEMTGMKRSRIYDLMKTGDFPRPFRLSTRCVGWKLSDLQKWINGRLSHPVNY